MVSGVFIMKLKNPRTVRGFSILAQSNQIEQTQLHTFKVKSQSSNGQYVVTNGVGWDCTCPDHVYRQVECKHIVAVKFWIELKKKIGSQNFIQLYEDVFEAKECKFCGSPKIVKWGKRKNKHGTVQRYECKSCGRWFTAEDGFSKMRVNPKIISLSLDLYFKGVSLRKIQDHITQFYNLKISHVAIFGWLKKYVKLINDFVDELEPELSKIWHTDEMKVRCGGKWVWLWNVMDNETRFLIANHISQKREVSDARKPFQKARKIAGTKPDFVVTDGLRSYQRAFKKEFFTLRNPRTKHIRNVGFRDKTNNNKIERFHGTFRERDKVMRGLKTEETAKVIAEGFRTYYNFLRPHSTLNGKTPAKEAEINLELGRNKWLSLIQKATETK